MKEEVIGLIGEFDWAEARDILVVGLMRCITEEDFKKVVLAIRNSVGTAKRLAKQREKLGLPPFTEEELDIIEQGGKK
jgi:propanediol dehydratase large subunit